MGDGVSVVNEPVPEMFSCVYVGVCRHKRLSVCIVSMCVWERYQTNEPFCDSVCVFAPEAAVSAGNTIKFKYTLKFE